MAALLVSAGIAGAASLSYTARTPGYPAYAGTDFSVDLGLPKFDTSLGRLNSVTLTLEADILGEAEIENRSNRTGNFTLEIGAEVELKGPPGLGHLLTALPSIVIETTLAAYDNKLDFAGASGRTYSGVEASDKVTRALVRPQDLMLFMGPPGSMITFRVEAEAEGSVKGSGNWKGGITTDARSLLSVTYDYSIVPEPASFVLLTAGLAGLGLVCRRRMRQSGLP